jgi:hypothetical protein
LHAAPAAAVQIRRRAAIRVPRTAARALWSHRISS